MDFDSKFLIIYVFIVQLTSFAAGIVRKHVNFVFTDAWMSLINVIIRFFLGFPG